MRKLRTIAVAFLVSLGSLFAAAPKPVQLSAVPLPVKVAASLAAESVQSWTSASLGDGPDNTQVYQVTGKTSGGKLVVVQVTDEGMVLHVRVEIALDEVPAAARDAVARKHPAFKATRVTAVGNTDDVQKASSYYYEGTGPGGKRMAVLVSANGGVVIAEGGQSAPKPEDTDVPPGPARKPVGDLKEMQGSWKVVTGRRAGNELATADGAGGKLVITDSNFELLDKDGAVLFQGALTLDAAATPRTFDVDGPQNFADTFLGMKGTLGLCLRGIYSLKDGQLRLCFIRNRDAAVPSRPGSFLDAVGLKSLDFLEFPEFDLTDPLSDPPDANCYYLRLEKVETSK
jgi:uncharacterized protein (TIGR03067 family)